MTLQDQFACRLCSVTQLDQCALQPTAKAGQIWSVAFATNVFYNAVQMKLIHDKELVCMAMTANLVAVGSQSHVSLLDPRIAQPTIRALDSIDPGQVNTLHWGKLKLRVGRCTLQAHLLHSCCFSWQNSYDLQLRPQQKCIKAVCIFRHINQMTCPLCYAEIIIYSHTITTHQILFALQKPYSMTQVALSSPQATNASVKP